MAPFYTNSLGALPYSIPHLAPRSLILGHSTGSSGLWKRGLPRNDVVAIIIVCLFAVLAVTAWVIVATRQRLMTFGRQRQEVDED